ncbi:MAG: potassium-transporting ATPase subunit KdpC [Acidobacteriaceae bacterium]|nr:potassium-transporting ATPase subunit KdpC [Acidobacteriaceae bacterium]
MHATTTLVSEHTAVAKAAPVQHPLWGTAIRFTLLTTLLLGIAYPLAVTGIASLLFPHQAAGSLIERNGQVIGSELLAQGFTSDRYFQPRPSAAGNGYDATSSGGSNLAQSSAKLVQRVQGDIDKRSKENPRSQVPIDLVTTSGSGLDPDITPDAAYFQAPRVAKARGLSEQTVRQLIAQHVTGRQFGLLGEQRVNVLELNLDLDRLGH